LNFLSTKSPRAAEPVIPATNTTMESELWNILVQNRDNGLGGIGLHTSTVLTPKPVLHAGRLLREFDSFPESFRQRTPP
jgi:hypothetical protein